MNSLWNPECEKDFFAKSLGLTTKEQLFYTTKDNQSVAYWPKKYKYEKYTLQSRNSFIGKYTEKWIVDLLGDFAKSKGLFAIQGVICEELGLTSKSSADVAFCKTNQLKQYPEDIVVIFEVKMSIVWNWEYKNNSLFLLGDFTTHEGNPGLLRSDSMLKAIGKSINIRVSGLKANKIPIIILGNTPISSSYYNKVDHLKNCGVIQGFWSLTPNPCENHKHLKNTPENGFMCMHTYDELISNLNNLLKEEFTFVSFMKSKKSLGTIIEISNKEVEIEKKAEKFLELIRN
jgi:hypothetical protein